ncbi:hypothetical protein OH457_24145 [Vibrio sp. 2art]|uniref:hypothetical protein n=1 Tax=Vibrio sp. 2art TaxID=2998832 RepID=UPI0022CD988F|nr:hypothetical protein [Vibrio sp. 2art]MDA0116330.1 hypothetical protein [Vibrio sp. 2art]
MTDIVLASQVATIIGAVATTLQFGISYDDAKKRLDPKEIASQAQILVNTYSDKELESIKRRIETCRDKFIAEGCGKQRVICFCSVLEDAFQGNGGSFPIQEWADNYGKLC